LNIFSENVREQENVLEESELDEIYDSTTSSPIYSSCGGVIDIETAEEPVLISYKENEEYDNNEMCVWIINNVAQERLRFRKLESGFEVPFDFIQISDNSFQTLMGNITGVEVFEMPTLLGFAFVMFSTDSSVTGRGFSLEIVGYENATETFVFRGFYSQANTGSTSLRPYFTNMVAPFIISPVNVNSSQLTVDYDLGNWYDTILVAVLERNGGIIRENVLDVLNGNGNRQYTATFYTTFALLFMSGSDGMGTGVALNWTSSNRATIS